MIIPSSGRTGRIAGALTSSDVLLGAHAGAVEQHWIYVQSRRPSLTKPP
jgi:hypothetical protein